MSLTQRISIFYFAHLRIISEMEHFQVLTNHAFPRINYM